MSGPAIDPRQFAALVRETPDEELERGLAVNRELILQGIFDAMPSQLRPGVDGAERLVVEWRITEGPDGGEDRWLVSVEAGGCRVERDGAGEPQAVLTAAPVDFVKVAAGVVAGPELFMSGRLRVEGDFLIAARLAALFAVPEVGA